MAGAQILQISGREIIFVDYSGCKPDQMIAILNQVKEIVVRKNKECLILNNFERCYATPGFLRHAEREMLEVKHLLKRNAFIGMTLPQRMILKGFKMFIGSNEYMPFDTREEAIDYLLGTDKN